MPRTPAQVRAADYQAKAESYGHVRIYAATGSRRIRAPFTLIDTFGNSLLPGMGDTGGLAAGGTGTTDSYNSSLNPTINDSWFSTSQYVSTPQNATFVQFKPDGTLSFGIDAQTGNAASSGMLCGWILNPRPALLHPKIGDNAGQFTQTPAQSFVAKTGAWKTNLDAHSPERTRLQNVDLTAWAQSADTIPKNRGYGFTLTFAGHKPNDSIPGALISLGDDAVFVRLADNKQVEVCLPNIDGINLFKTLPTPALNLSNAYHTLGICRVAGHLVILWDGQGYWVPQTKVREGQSEARPVTASWPTGKVNIRLYNVRASIGIEELKWSAPSGTPYTSTIQRYARRNVPTGPNNDGAQPIAGQLAGWAGGGTLASVAVVESDSPNIFRYDVGLQASPDGIDTPFISKAMFHDVGAWQGESGDYIDVSDCIKSMSISMPSPPEQPSTVPRLTLDRIGLNERHPNWQSYISNYNAVEIELGWRDSNGDIQGSPTKLFQGLLTYEGEEWSSYNQQELTLTAIDDIGRLQGENAKIDHRVPPFDYYFAFFGLRTFYGAQGVREMVRHFLGNTKADNLSVFFSDNHYALISADNDSVGYLAIEQALAGDGGSAPPTSSGLLLPVTYDNDALTEIQTLADDDDALFTMLWAPGDNRANTFPHLTYGKVANLLQGAPIWRVTDADYLSGDRDRFMKQLSIEYKVDRNINRVLVWSNPPGTSDNPFYPALRMAEAREETFAPASLNRASLTFERTLIINSHFGYLPEACEYLSASFMRATAGINKFWPRDTVKGDAFGWGDAVFFRINSTSNLAIKSQTLRIENVEHHTGASCKEWESDIASRPLLNGELETDGYTGGSVVDNTVGIAEDVTVFPSINGGTDAV